MARIRKSLKRDQIFQQFCSSRDKTPLPAGEGGAPSWWPFLRKGYQKAAISHCTTTEPLRWTALLEVFLICFFEVSSCLTQKVLKIALSRAWSSQKKRRQEGTYKAPHSYEENSKAWVYFKYLIKDQFYYQNFILPRIFITRILLSRTGFITRILYFALFGWTAQESKHP